MFCNFYFICVISYLMSGLSTIYLVSVMFWTLGHYPIMFALTYAFETIVHRLLPTCSQEWFHCRSDALIVNHSSLNLVNKMWQCPLLCINIMGYMFWRLRSILKGMGDYVLLSFPHVFQTSLGWRSEQTKMIWGIFA